MGIFNKKKSVNNRYAETTAKDRTGWNPLATLDFYTKLLAEYLDKSSTPDKTLGNGEFFYTSDAIFTKNGVKKVFFINEMPLTIPRYFISDLRDSVYRAISQYNSNNRLNSKVSVTLLIEGQHFPFEFSDYRIAGVWQSFTRQYERVADKVGDMELKDALNTDKYSDNVVRKVNSFLHLKEAKARHASFYRTKLAIELVVVDDTSGLALDSLKIAEKAVADFFTENALSYKRLFLDPHNYYKNYSPTSNSAKTLMRKKYEGAVYSDDTITSFTAPNHGIIGDKRGIPFGVDMFIGEPIFIDFLEDKNAKNILIAAGTGEGKSFRAKDNFVFTTAQPEYQTIAFDYEGTEYTGVGYICDSQNIRMKGMYVDTLDIPDAVGDEELDSERWDRCKEITKSVFDVLCNPQTGMTNRQQAIFSDLMAEVYGNVGVGEDVETWSRAKGLTYYMLYDILVNKYIHGENSTARENHTEAELKDFRNTLKPYFEEGGLYASWFKYNISIEDFLEAESVIFNFGMGTKSEIMTDERSIILQQLFASHLTILKASRNKANGILTAVYIEEMQRYLNQPYSAKIVGTLVSGGRKLGLINYLLTNDPSGLLMAGDMDSPLIKENVSAIVSGITMVCIGALYEKDMIGLIDQFGLEKSFGYLRKLVEVKESNIRSGGYKYAFFMNHRGKATLVKSISSPALEGLDIYETDVNPLNNGLRSGKAVGSDSLDSGINKAFKKDGEWDEEGRKFTSPDGVVIEKLWLSNPDAHSNEIY